MSWDHRGLGPLWVKIIVGGRPRLYLRYGVEPSEVEPFEGRDHWGGATLIRGEDALARGKRTDRSMKNLLTQWEIRRKTVVENFL